MFNASLFKTSFLLASLVWGSVGVGYFIYGRKQQSLAAMLGGVLMVFVSYFVSSALLMSLICAAIIAAVIFLIKRA